MGIVPGTEPISTKAMSAFSSKVFFSGNLSTSLKAPLNLRPLNIHNQKNFAIAGGDVHISSGKVSTVCLVANEHLKLSKVVANQLEEGASAVL